MLMDAAGKLDKNNKQAGSLFIKTIFFGRSFMIDLLLSMLIYKASRN